jgi:hypothetical protein
MRHRHRDLPVTGGTNATRAEAAQRLASVPPLPLTLDWEGADQPFWLEIVAAQASWGRWTRRSFIVRTS